MYRVLFKKIESTHNNVRTTETEGACPSLPEVGFSFRLFADPLTEGANLRMITTTKVAEMRALDDGEIVFKTANSTYAVTVLEDLDES